MGRGEGTCVGRGDGMYDGFPDGDAVGVRVGLGDGAYEGAADGELVEGSGVGAGYLSGRN